MAQLPKVLTQTEVSGPPRQRAATAEDFGAGKDTLIGATRSASNAARGSADAARVRGRGIRQASDAALRAETALAQGWDAMGNAAAKIGDVVYKREEQREIADVHAKLAEGQAKWATHLDDKLRTATPGDDQVVPGFLKDFDEYGKGLSETYKTAGGQQYAGEGLARLRGHFFETAMKGQARLAAAKRVADYIGHQNSSTVAVQKDPEGLPLALERLDRFLESAVELDPEKRLEMQVKGRAELTRASVYGIIDRNWRKARQRLKSGEFSQFLDADDTRRLVDATEAKEREEKIERDRQEAERRRGIEESQKAVGNEFVGLLAEGKLDPGRVVKSNLDWREKEHFLNAIEHKARASLEGREPKTDYGLARRLVDKIESGEFKDERQLYKYLYRDESSQPRGWNQMWDRGSIDERTLNQLSGMIRSQNKAGAQALRASTRELKATAKRLIIGSLMFKDADGPASENYYKFGAELDETVERYKDEGKDVGALFDPDSKDFFGKRINSYIVARDEQRKALRAKLRGQVTAFGAAGSVEPRKPGESMTEYLKRTGGSK